MLEIVEIKLRGNAADIKTLMEMIEAVNSASAVVGSEALLEAEAARAAAAVGNAPANDPAPAAAPLTNAAATAPAGERDDRGVVWHADHHSSTKGKNTNGSWSARRNSDKAARDAYEAQFLGKSQNGTSGTVQSTTAESGGSADAAAALAQMPVSGGMPGATVQAPPAGAPGYDDLVVLWLDLVKTARVDSRHENYIIQTYGGHITFGDVFKNDPVARKACYDELIKLKV